MDLLVYGSRSVRQSAVVLSANEDTSRANYIYIHIFHENVSKLGMLPTQSVYADDAFSCLAIYVISPLKIAILRVYIDSLTTLWRELFLHV